MTPPESQAQSRQLYVSSDLAINAPYIRNPLNVRLAMRCLLLATLPCTVFALYNTGYQANLAWAQAMPMPGWRAQLLRVLGLGHSPDAALDCMGLGALFFLPLLVAVWLAAGLSEQGFARARGRAVDHVTLPVFAVLFTLCLPATLSLWHAAVGSAIGVIVGKEIFGGFGRNFVNPVVVGLAFLLFAYPRAMGGDTVWVPVPEHVGPTILSIANRLGLAGVEATGSSWSAVASGWTPGAMGETSALACLLGFVFLVYTGIASWRIVAGGLLGMILGVFALQSLELTSAIATLPWHWHLVTGNFAFGLVFLATDPVTAATTNPGRWLFGLLIGAFVAVVRVANPAYQDGMILALLLGNVMAPLLDRMVGYAQLGLNRANRG